MSPFYRELSNYYDVLFPLNQTTLEFVRSFITAPDSIVLDIGCATGQMAISLAEGQGTPATIKSVVAIDPDEKMVALLKERTQQKGLDPTLTVLTGGMSDLNSLFNPATFHLILCLGNTLVHLTTLQKIQDFFQSAYNRLRNGGIFLVQIVNYTRILTQNIQELPFIDKPTVSLTRQYHFHPTHPLIQFLTAITLKETGEVIQHETSLYPLEYHQVVPIIRQCGFEAMACFGSFNREPWDTHSPALILVLQKN